MTRFFKVLHSKGIGFNRNYDGMILPLVHADSYNIKGYHTLRQPPIDNNGNTAQYENFVTMQEGDSIEEVFLTDAQKTIIYQEYRNYDCSMSDPWRNDFSDDGQADDEWRRENMLNNIREQMPEIPEQMIEDEIDRIS